MESNLIYFHENFPMICLKPIQKGLTGNSNKFNLNMRIKFFMETSKQFKKKGKNQLMQLEVEEPNSSCLKTNFLDLLHL